MPAYLTYGFNMLIYWNDMDLEKIIFMWQEVPYEVILSGVRMNACIPNVPTNVITGVLTIKVAWMWEAWKRTYFKFWFKFTLPVPS